MFKPMPEMLKKEENFEKKIERELVEFKNTKEYLDKNKFDEFFKSREEKINIFYNSQKKKAIEIFVKPPLDFRSQLKETRGKMQQYADTINPKRNRH